MSTEKQEGNTRTHTNLGIVKTFDCLTSFSVLKVYVLRTTVEFKVIKYNDLSKSTTIRDRYRLLKCMLDNVGTFLLLIYFI